MTTYLTKEIFLLTPQGPLHNVEYSATRTVYGSPFGNNKLMEISATRTGQPFTFLQSSEAERTTLRDFFRARLGSFESFWLPSWSDDFNAKETTASGGTVLTINRVRFADFVGTGHLIIRYTGSDFATAISASANVDDDTETLTVSAIPADVTISTSLQLLRLCRFGNDQLNFEMVGRTQAGAIITTASLSFIDVPGETT